MRTRFLPAALTSSLPSPHATGVATWAIHWRVETRGGRGKDVGGGAPDDLGRGARCAGQARRPLGAAAPRRTSSWSSAAPTDCDGAGARVVPRRVALVGASVGALACDHGVARSRATICTTLLATRGALRVALIVATPGARAVARSMGPAPAACGPPDRWKVASGCWLAAARAAILAPLAGCCDVRPASMLRVVASPRNRKATHHAARRLAAGCGPTGGVPRRTTRATRHPTGSRRAPTARPPGRDGSRPRRPTARPGWPLRPLVLAHEVDAARRFDAALEPTAGGDLHDAHFSAYDLGRSGTSEEICLHASP